MCMHVICVYGECRDVRVRGGMCAGLCVCGIWGCVGCGVCVWSMLGCVCVWWDVCRAVCVWCGEAFEVCGIVCVGGVVAPIGCREG